MKRFLMCLTALILLLTSCTSLGTSSNLNSEKDGNMPENTYLFPAEETEHEGTWLNWPHHYTYGKAYRDEIEPIWLEITAALSAGERVHIVAYNEQERARITKLLSLEGVDLSQVDFVIAKSDDVWSRDTGPLFVFDKDEQLNIVDFAFDGWGKKAPYKNDDQIPKVAAKAKGLPVVNVPGFVLEGGSVELDGAGTLMACKSSVISKNRNSGMTQKQAEQFLKTYFGVQNFIWLDGVTDEDITDAHIDAMARFYDKNTILTVSEGDFFELYENIPERDYDALLSAKNADGKKYKLTELPMTAENVRGLDYKGSYLNYYIGNETLLLPVYGDKNDDAAQQILSELYSNKKIVPIDVTALYKYGGMLHCITQQQPAAGEKK